MILDSLLILLMVTTRCLSFIKGVESLQVRATYVCRTSSSLSAGAERKSSRSRRKERKDNQPTVDLEWERFDFSQSPKWDRRFTGDGLHVASNTDDWEAIAKIEAEYDVALQKDFERRHELWNSLDDELVLKATQALVPFIQEERWNRIQSIMLERTQQTKFLFENVSNPSNCFACLRTIDSFGMQNVDLVMQSGQYQGKAALNQKRGMRTAAGAAKWLTIRNHLSTELALNKMKQNGYHIMCTDVNPESKDIREIDWDASGKKICIVMGNEERGVSGVAKTMSDESFYINMCGMAESFNLSVATAIICAHMSAASKDGKGPLRPGDLSKEEYNTLLLKGVLNSMKPKLARALLTKNGVELPKELNIS
ncbi:unnamed protein product [Cylindrotheca closterium]|uniref:tRNA/rRNA methyltransferase SpoU type domain-containing protein n=1 Tax=Cylindrotheca closterium TaxID=2856 RepID=A0AAD2CR29_9STRA|nr:unnamed protein product [Cylindrotheca closterium]